MYISNLAKDLIENENPKPFWNFVKSKRKGTNNLISLKVGNSVLTNDKCIADSTNSYFSFVFTVGNLGNLPVLGCVIITRN